MGDDAESLPELSKVIRVLLRRAFLQGFVEGRDPKTPGGALYVLAEAESHFEKWEAENDIAARLSKVGGG